MYYRFPMSVLKSKNTKHEKISSTFLAFVSLSLEEMGMPPGERERDTTTVLSEEFRDAKSQFVEFCLERELPLFPPRQAGAVP